MYKLMARYVSRTETIKLIDKDGETQEVRAHKLKQSDVNGNARWVIHYTVMNTNYSDIRLSKLGFNRYRAKWYGGGLVTQSSYIQGKVQEVYNQLHSL